MSRDSSALCAACGLCCNGVLHSTVTVMPQDLNGVRALGLPVEQDHQGCFQFHQPCPLHRDDHCTVYPNRPASCQTYQCALLRKTDRGTLALDAALAIVGTAKGLLSDCRDLTGSDGTRDGLGRYIDGLWAGGPPLGGEGLERQANGEASLLVTTLYVYLEQHFRTATGD